MSGTRPTPSRGGRGPARELSEPQARVLDFVAAYTRRQGVPPSLDEVAGGVGRGRSATAEALQRLERAGYISRDHRKKRSIELTAKSGAKRFLPSGRAVHLPLVGDVCAGDGIYAEGNIEAVHDVPSFMLREGDEGFLLRVVGDSMIDAGINEGDMLVVTRQETAEEGQIVVALIGESDDTTEATVKRFYRDRGRVILKPENDAYEPLRPEYVRIVGVVGGLLRPKL